MFLHELKPKQKALFLDIAIHMAQSDSDFSYSEKEMVKRFCQEMATNVRFEAIHSMKEALSELNSISSVKEKRMILLELTGIILADSVFSTEEDELIKEICVAMGIETDIIENLVSITKEYYEVCRKINRFICYQM